MGARYHTCRQDFPTVMALSKYKVAPLLLGKITEIFRGMRVLLHTESIEDPRYAQLSMDDCLDFFGAPNRPFPLHKLAYDQVWMDRMEDILLEEHYRQESQGCSSTPNPDDGWEDVPPSQSPIRSQDGYDSS